MSAVASMRDSILRADTRLSKYNPLSRILFYDDFDEGVNGWCELVGNHAGNLDDIRGIARDFRPPQLSSCTFFDIGTHGSIEGTYSLKMATRAVSNHAAIAIKRLTYMRRGLVQFETYFTFKAEQTFDRAALSGWDGNKAPSERQFGDFSFSNDICDGENGKRYMGLVRYLNTDVDGNLVQKWMHKTSVQPTTRMERQGVVPPNQDFHTVNPDDWEEIPGGNQPLCFNETASKVNWHYLKWTMDTSRRRMVELQCNDNVMDLSSIEVPVYDGHYHGLPNLLNFLLDVRTHTNVRNFLYLDSVLVSVDW